MKQLLIVIGITVVISAFGFAGEGDYQIALDIEQTYCENVKAGTWGAYNPETDCSKY